MCSQLDSIALVLRRSRAYFLTLAAACILAAAGPASAQNLMIETEVDAGAEPAVTASPSPEPAHITPHPFLNAVVEPAVVEPAVAEPAVVEPASARPDSNGSSDDDDWKFTVTPYAFLGGVNGEIRARSRVVQFSAGFGEILDVLKFAAGIRVEGEHDPWGFAFDNDYVHVGKDVSTAQPLFPDFRFDLAVNITDLEPSYRIWRTGEAELPVGGPAAALDIIGGVRIIHVDTTLDIFRTIFPDEHLQGTATYVQGYLGNRFISSPWKHVSFEARYNIALSNDFSWGMNSTVYIQPWDRVSFGGGLQILDLSLQKDSNDAALDARFFGPIVYLKFHF